MPRYTEDERKEKTKIAVKLYAEGCSTVQIGKVVGVANQTVREWLIKAGVKLRPPERANKIACDVEKLKTLADSGATIKEISEKMYASTATVNKWLKENGIKINTKARKRMKKEAASFRKEEKQEKKCRTCMYRSGNPSYGCNYALVKKHSRRCPIIGCIKYEKGRRIRLKEECVGA